jgi:hypothetical protein
MESISLQLERVHELLLLIQGCHILLHHNLSLSLLLGQKLISLGMEGLEGQRVLSLQRVKVAFIMRFDVREFMIIRILERGQLMGKVIL